MKTEQNTLLTGLNPAQMEAVQHVEGPLLILAGAGSGKTRVLTHRIAYLIEECGLDPYHVLAITFTNKAAQELRTRIQSLIGEKIDKMQASTFHSACAQILRRDAHHLGFKSNFAIYDQDDSRRLVQACVRQLNLDVKKFTPRSIKAKISFLKNELIDADACASQACSAADDVTAEVYRLYGQKLMDNNAMDFDDLLVNTVHLLRLFKDVREKYRDRFQYILIDEYQDTNKVQYEMVKILADKYRNICVVGDDDQSIYKFRGADVRNILEFENDYADAKVIKLEQNYRSTRTILDVANNIIKQNVSRKPKTLWTENDIGDRAVLYRANNEHDEAYFLTGTIKVHIDSGNHNYRDMAVFYRTNAQSRVLEDVFVREGVPYKIVGGIRFYERSEIKDILAYLRVLVNPLDVISLKRIINRPKRGIGDTTIARIERFAAINKLSFWDALSRANEVSSLSPAAVRKLEMFMELMSGFAKDATEMPLDTLVETILEKTGFLPGLKAEDSIEAIGRIENLHEFVAAIREFIGYYPESQIGEFLEAISLITDIDKYDEADNAVTLMTLHNAKGLEFPVVFMVGMEEGVFPHYRSLGDANEGEEERRLCYVGATRAKKLLYLTHAVCRDLYGTTNYNTISQFVADIPKVLVDEINPDVSGFLEPDEDYLDFTVGDAVRHSKFGDGKVKTIPGPGEIIVAFRHGGEKKLLLAYAKLIRL